MIVLQFLTLWPQVSMGTVPVTCYVAGALPTDVERFMD